VCTKAKLFLNFNNSGDISIKIKTTAQTANIIIYINVITITHYHSAIVSYYKILKLRAMLPTTMTKKAGGLKQVV